VDTQLWKAAALILLNYRANTTTHQHFFLLHMPEVFSEFGSHLTKNILCLCSTDQSVNSSRKQSLSIKREKREERKLGVGSERHYSVGRGGGNRNKISGFFNVPRQCPLVLLASGQDTDFCNNRI
jgi:hypothetical protein